MQYMQSVDDELNLRFEQFAKTEEAKPKAKKRKIN